MGTKTYELMFQVAASMNQKFSSVFKKAANLTKIAEERVDSFNKTSSKIDGLNRQIEATKKLSAQYFRQKAALDNLRSAMSRTNAPSAVMKTAAARLTKEVETSKIKLDAEVRSLANLRKELGVTGLSMQQLSQKQAYLSKKATEYSKIISKNNTIKKIKGIQNSLRENGVGSMVALSTIGTEVARFTAMPVKQAMQMEDAMAEIRKVVDFSTPDGLKNMQKALEEMSLTIPITADGLAQITAAAGQAGIKEKDLIRFTETAAKMGVAFDMTAGEAGEMMAKWRAGMNLTQDQAESLADATNALSNENAAMAKQVGEALKRYGALGQVAGLTAKQTAAMAATLIGAGAEAEVAATGMNAFMRTMTKGGSMTDLQKAAFGNLGFDAKQLQKEVQKDAPKAIFSVLEAIKNKLPKELQMQYLTAMFGEEGARAMGPMIANIEKLRENFALVADETKYAGSMEKEFAARAKTTSNALTLASNAVSYFVRGAGEPLLEPLREGALEFVKYGKVIGDWIKENKQLTLTVMKVSGAVLGGVAAFHGLKIAAFLLGAPVLTTISLFLQIGKAAVFLKNSTLVAKLAVSSFAFASNAAAASFGLLKGAVSVLGMAMKGLLLNPVGLAIGAFAALVAAGVYVYRNWDEIKAKLSSLWTAFSEKFPGMASFVMDFYENVIKPKVDAVKTTFQGLTDFISGVFLGDWTKAWEGMKTTFSGVFASIPAIAKTPLNGAITLINSAFKGINQLANAKIPDWVPIAGGQTLGFTLPEIPLLANGGIATGPSLAMVGEGRESEAIIPLSKLGGMLESRGSPSIQVSFSPVINISGGGTTKEEVQSGLQAGVKDLKKELERLINSQRRLSYA